MAKKSSDPSHEIIRPDEMIIHEGNYFQVCDPDVEVGGEKKARGLIPRDFKTHPLGCYEGIPKWVVDMPTIPRSEWSERARDQLKAGRRCSDFRRRGKNGSIIESRDQNGRGYCWFHSGTSAVLVQRARMNEPYADLSAYAGACKIKNFRDEGGWGAQGVDFMMKYGIPTSEFWPQKATSKGYDNDKTWANALLHRVTEGWMDMNAGQYDRNLTWDQYVTCWLLGESTVNDYNWWGHSVCGLDVVEGAQTRKFCRDPISGKLLSLKAFNLLWAMDDEVMAGFGCRIWNSWGDSWSDKGEGLLTGSKAVPDGGVALRVVTPSDI